MLRELLLPTIIVTLSAAFPLEAEDLRKQAQQNTDTVRSESQKKVEKILACVAEFRSDLEKLKPGLDIVFPVDTKNASKLRLIDHNELTGIREAPKVFAIVTQEYRLKTWHSDSDSQNLECVRAGDKVEVVMTVNPRGGGFVWALFRTESESEGYIPQMYLKNLPEQAQPNTKQKETKYNMDSSPLGIRSEPSLAGELIGYVGKTGKATGPHLHFEVRVGKDPKDPLQYLK